jgi:hypothetical protein
MEASKNNADTLLHSFHLHARDSPTPQRCQESLAKVFGVTLASLPENVMDKVLLDMHVRVGRALRLWLLDAQRISISTCKRLPRAIDIMDIQRSLRLGQMYTMQQNRRPSSTAV